MKFDVEVSADSATTPNGSGRCGSVVFAGSGHSSLRCSFRRGPGATEWTNTTVNVIMKNARQLLKAAKREGRDRVVVYGATEMPPPKVQRH